MKNQCTFQSIDSDKIWFLCLILLCLLSEQTNRQGTDRENSNTGVTRIHLDYQGEQTNNCNSVYKCIGSSCSSEKDVCLFFYTSTGSRDKFLELLNTILQL